MVVFGILISYLTVRKRSFLTGILDTVTMFPYIIPGSVLGISFLYAFNSKPLLLSGTAIIIIISLSIRRMPYTIRSSTAIIGQISPSVEEAAISLGCTETKSFVKVTVPMMMSGVLSGAIMSWIHPDQRAQFLHYPVYQQNPNPDSGHLRGGHPEQLRQCRSLLHHPDPDQYPVPSGVL